MSEKWSKYSFALFAGRTLHLALFDNVTNSGEVLKKILAGEFVISALNPKLIYGELQVLSAATRVLDYDTRKALRCNNIQTEMIYSLSGTRNMSRSIRNFGMQKNTKEFFVVAFDASPDTLKQIESQINGTIQHPILFDKYRDEKQIIKEYKISTEQQKMSDLELAIVNRIAVESV
eukprot:TRINITY_DN977_c0_g1_i2.p1 TRINITY_DN977_c0_g1~~TRINITY_DN977_c0_g1_i2.p1  ORF type:complete len:198 (+),score=31.81 TRINITY_DN977_c0_g1_i2:69-596(+)